MAMITTKAIILDTDSHGKQLRDVVKQALYDRKVKIVLGKDTSLHREVSGKNQNPKKKDEGRRYREFSRNKFYHFICGESVNKREKQLRKENCYTSTDPHIIALAIISGANILVSNDRELIDDFKGCAAIDARSDCLSKKGRVIERKAIRPVSPNDRIVGELLRNARIKYECCECMINGGGC